MERKYNQGTFRCCACRGTGCKSRESGAVSMVVYALIDVRKCALIMEVHTYWWTYASVGSLPTLSTHMCVHTCVCVCSCVSFEQHVHFWAKVTYFLPREREKPSQSDSLKQSWLLARVPSSFRRDRDRLRALPLSAFYAESSSATCRLLVAQLRLQELPLECNLTLAVRVWMHACVRTCAFTCTWTVWCRSLCRCHFW
jgi:hypothetical protein